MSDANIDFKNISDVFQGKGTMNTDKKALTYQRQKVKTARIPNTTLTLKTPSISQGDQLMSPCISNENNIAPSEERAVTEGHPAAHSSHMDGVTKSVSQVTSHRPPAARRHYHGHRHIASISGTGN